MAYATINVTINGATKPAIDVSGDGLEVIMEESLSNYDKDVMDAISDEAGATFADKMAAYTDPKTGITADVLYAKFVRVVADYSAQTLKAAADTYQNAVAIAANADAIDALDVRVTALEP